MNNIKNMNMNKNMGMTKSILKIIVVAFMMIATIAIPFSKVQAAELNVGSNIMAAENYILLSTYGDPEDLASILDPTSGVGSVVYEFAKVLGAIMTFVSVIMIGCNIILARHKAEERTNAMTGFMYVTIGVIILSAVLLIYTFLGSLVGDPESELDGTGGQPTNTATPTNKDEVPNSTRNEQNVPVSQ